MARLILDTSVLIDLERTQLLMTHLAHPDDEIAIAALTLAEIQLGVELASTRRRAERQHRIDALVSGLIVVPYDVDIARRHAILMAATRRQGRTRGAHDLIIAATASFTDRLVVTSDPRGFADLPGVSVASWPETR